MYPLHHLRTQCIERGVSYSGKETQLYYLRLCGKYTDWSLSRLSNDVIALDMINLIHTDAMFNEFIGAYALFAFESGEDGQWQHVEYRNLNQLIRRYPNQRIGDAGEYTWSDIIEARRELFPGT